MWVERESTVRKSQTERRRRRRDIELLLADLYVKKVSPRDMAHVPRDPHIHKVSHTSVMHECHKC